jgi:TfoX/Sxy family transcriptional regulator of competence genes
LFNDPNRGIELWWTERFTVPARGDFTLPFDELLASRVRRVLVGKQGWVEKKMFGGIGFLWNGNMTVGVWKDMLIARVGPDEYAAALARGEVREFDITGRPMRGWVLVLPRGLESDQELRAWVGLATRFVRTLEPAPPRAPRQRPR